MIYQRSPIGALHKARGPLVKISGYINVELKLGEYTRLSEISARTYVALEVHYSDKIMGWTYQNQPIPPNLKAYEHAIEGPGAFDNTKSPDWSPAQRIRSPAYLRRLRRYCT